MKALAQRFEGKVRPIVGILGILAAIDAHFPALRGLRRQWQSYTANQ
jgi:hypothetical protein